MRTFIHSRINEITRTQIAHTETDKHIDKNRRREIGRQRRIDRWIDRHRQVLVDREPGGSERHSCVRIRLPCRSSGLSPPSPRLSTIYQHLSNYPSIYPSLSISLSVYPSIYLSFSVYLSLCLLIYISILLCLSISLSTHLSMYTNSQLWTGRYYQRDRSRRRLHSHDLSR